MALKSAGLDRGRGWPCRFRDTIDTGVLVVTKDNVDRVLTAAECEDSTTLRAGKAGAWAVRPAALLLRRSSSPEATADG